MTEKVFDRIYTAFIFIATLTFAILTPLLQVPDEIVHFYRAFELSRGYCIPPATLSIPSAFPREEAAYHPFLDQDVHVPHDELFEREITSLAQFDMSGRLISAPPPHQADAYSCLLYFPASLALAVLRDTRATLPQSLIVARIVSALVSSALIVLGFRLMPFGRELYAFISLLPMQLQQIGSVSADSIGDALALLATSAFLRIAVSLRTRLPNKELVTWSVILSAVLGAARLDAIVIFLLALSPLKPTSRPKTMLYIAACWLIAIGSMIVFAKVGVVSNSYVAYRRSLGLDNSVGIAAFAKRPLLFERDLWLSLSQLGWHYLSEIVGTFGWLTAELPQPVVWVGVLAFFVLASRTTIERVDVRRARVVCASISLAYCVMIFIIFFIADARLQVALASAQVQPIAGIQGRYFLPILVTAGISIASSKRHDRRLDRFMALWFALILIAFGIGTDIDHFYV